MEERIRKIFKDNDLHYEWDEDLTLPVVYVHVLWGDWKHDHAYLKHVMQENDFIFIGEEITEEDGSDCYSATHTYLSKTINL